MPTKTKKPPVIRHRGSLMTYGHDDSHCLGYLWDAGEMGIHDPDLGRVAVTPEEARQHNAALDEVMIDGLDRRCAVGQRGTFYIGGPPDLPVVRTWTGALVSDDVERVGRIYTFHRNGRTFVGQRRDDFITFTRTA